MELHHAVAAAYAQRRAVARFAFDIRVAAVPSEALVLFTPEGERAWDPQWAPVYAGGSPPEHLVSGTVFTTDEHHMPRVWLVDAYDPKAGLIRYTVFAPQQSVTRITVNVQASGNGSIARISYDRTSIAAAADAEVAAFASHGERMREEWQKAIDSATAR